MISQCAAAEQAAVLAALAAITLDGVLRYGVRILMAELAAKTWIAYKAGR